tara:strand:- start:1363 stop:1701 length:339 start_codon:yes stop_codon:yes gene_type:complete
MGKKRKIINSTKYARKYSNHPLARARAEKPAVVEAVEVVVEAVQDVVETVVEAVAETVQSVVEDVSETVQSVVEDVSDVVSYEKPSNPVKTSKVRKAAPKRKPTKKNKKSEG